MSFGQRALRSLAGAGAPDDFVRARQLHRSFGGARRFAALTIAALSMAASLAHATIWYGNIPGAGSSGCTSGVYTVPAGASYVEVTAIGQQGSDGTAFMLTDYSEGVGGLGGIVKVVAAVTPGQKLWAAPTSSLFEIWGVTSGGGSGGYGSFVATADPGSACPFGKPDKSSLLVVAGGGGGGASGSPRGTGGSGGSAGPNGVNGGNGGNNGQQDGGGGGGGTQTGGGFGGAGGHGNIFASDAPRADPGGYFGGGAPGSASLGADSPSQPGGGGGGGYYGGGGGGGDAGGGGGGGGGGSNYIVSSIPTDAPLYNRPTGTWINGSTSDGAKVQIVPIFSTTTTISSSPNPSALNQSITITVNIASSGGGPPPGGDVKFYDGTTLLGTVASSGGVATFQTSTLTSGTHYLQATYLGDGSDGGGIHFASATHGTDVGGVILPYQHVVGAPPVTYYKPTITQQPLSQGGYYGQGSAYFEVEATGTPDPSVQWQVSSDNGATFTDTSGSGGFSANYLAVPLEMARNGNKYRAIVSNAAGAVTSNVVTLTVMPWTLWITANDKSVDYLGQIPALDVRYGDGQSGANFVNGDTPASLNGTLACTTTATSSSLPGTYPITCSGVSSPNYTITFKPGTLTVNAPTQKIVVDGSIPQTPPPGSPGRLTYKSVALGTTYDITAYGGNSGQPITFAVSPPLGPAPDFACADAYGGCTDVVEGTSTPVCSLVKTANGAARISFNAVLKQFRIGRCYVNLNQAGATINGAVYPAAAQVQLDFQINYGAPAITTQPVDQNVSVGQTATFTIAATGAPPPTLQWQVSVDNGATFNDVPGASAPTLTVANVHASQNGNRYRVLVSNNPNQNLVYLNTDLVSNVATLNVAIPPGAPYVSLDPADTTTMDSSPMTFTSIGGGNPAPTSVLWQMSNDGGASYSDVVPDPYTIVGMTNNAGAVTTTLKLSIPAYTYNGRLYRAVFTNANGSATSNAAKLTVQDRIIIINNGKPADQTVAAGQTATFDLDYIAEPAPTFQWQKKIGSTWTDIPGATARTLTLANVTPALNGSQYQVVLTQGSPFNVTATSRTATLTVSGASPILTTPALSNLTFGMSLGDSATLSGGYSPTGTLTFKLFGAGDTTCSAAPVFTSTVTVAGNGAYASATFTPAAVGTYQWTVAYSGDANNTAIGTTCGTSGQSVVVAKASQSIAFGAAPSVAVGGSGTVTATGGASGNAVVFGTISAPSICTVSAAGSVVGVGAGNCVVTADQAGNANYNPALQVTQTVGITKGSQSIVFGAAPSVAVGGSGTASATGGASGNAIVFGTISSASICTVSAAGNVVGIGAGNCVVTANQAGNANYNPALQVTQTVGITKGSQSIVFGAAPSVAVGGSGTVSATGGASGNPIVFGTISAASICTVSAAGNVVGVGAGNCVVTADQAGNANYNPALQATQTVGIVKGSQSIVFGAAPSVAVGGSGTVSATGGASGNPIVFGTISAASICTVSAAGNVVGVGAGNCVVTADQAGNANYNPALQATQTVGIVKGSQSIVFGAAPSVAVGGSGTVTAAGGASGNPVTFGTISAASVCTVSAAGNVVGVGAGNCVVTADQAGNANYNAALQATQTVGVAKGSQSIAFGAAPSVAVGGSGTVNATGGASGNPVVFGTTSAASICTVSAAGNVVGVGAGACMVTANQVGDANYLAAPQATQTVAIAQAAGAIALASDKNSVVYGEAFTLTATLTTANPAPGGTVAFSDGGNAVAACANVAVVGKTAQCTPNGLDVATHAFIATYSGDANTAGAANDPAVEVTIAKAATIVAITPPAAVTLGNAANLAVSVSVASPGAGTPTGSVTVSDGSASCQYDLPAAGCSLSPISAGGKTLTATYVPDASAAASFTGNSGTASLAVNPAAAAMTLASSANPSVFGQSVSLTATIDSAAGGPASGAVAFTDGGNAVAGCAAVVLTAAGQTATATCTTSNFAVGSHVLAAGYAGDTNHLAANATAAQTVDAAATTLTITPPGTVALGHALDVTVSVAAKAPGAGTPTGSVVIADGSANCTATLMNGSGHCMLTPPAPAGSHALTAGYAATTDFAASGASANLDVQAAAPGMTLASSVDAAVFGQSILLTATITPDAGNPQATGSVDFAADAAPLCSNVALVAGAAVCSTASLSVGSHAITASYAGDVNTAAANAALTQTVAKAQTTLTVTANPSPLVWTQPVTVAASVAATAPGAGTPTGAITVGDGTETCTITLPATSCTLTPSAYGNLVVTASYAGDANFAAATQSATLGVETAHMTATLACTPSQATAGMTVNCQATCTNVGPAIALDAQCSLTTASASNAGTSRSIGAAVSNSVAAAAPSCTPAVPVVSLAVNASIVCTTSFVNAGTTVSASASASNVVAGPDSTSTITFSAGGPAVPAPALQPMALAALVLCVAGLAFVPLRRRRLRIG